MTLTSGHREDRRRAYLEGGWRGRHQAGGEGGQMQVEENRGGERRQILGGDAQGGGDPGQPGQSIHSFNMFWIHILVNYSIVGIANQFPKFVLRLVVLRM